MPLQHHAQGPATRNLPPRHARPRLPTRTTLLQRGAQDPADLPRRLLLPLRVSHPPLFPLRISCLLTFSALSLYFHGHHQPPCPDMARKTPPPPTYRHAVPTRRARLRRPATPPPATTPRESSPPISSPHLVFTHIFCPIIVSPRPPPTPMPPRMARKTPPPPTYRHAVPTRRARLRHC
ncbi:hypothetical protein EDB89DRAFT_2078603 [Lactarius sanguifluus]|nr:hypothetical protein EDB89DRAFT_2078603 [Lactarius sanguifluus]